MPRQRNRRNNNRRGPYGRNGSSRRQVQGQNYGQYPDQRQDQGFGQDYAQNHAQHQTQYQANGQTANLSGANSVPLGHRDGNAPVFVSNVAARAIIDNGGSVPTTDVITELPRGGYSARTGLDTLLQGIDMMAAMIGSSEIWVEIFPILEGDDAKLRAGKTVADLDIKARLGYSSFHLPNPSR